MVTDDWRSRLKDGNELRTYNSKTRGHSTSLEKTGDQPFVDITASDQSQSRDSDQVSDDFFMSISQKALNVAMAMCLETTRELNI